MNELLSVCIEHVDSDGERFVRCVAMPGRVPGLRLDARGRDLWRSEAGAVCELWRSADGRLVLWRLEGSQPVVVSRAGRSLAVPAAKPVMLLDKDELAIGGRKLRLHLHGTTHVEAAPQPLAVERRRPVFRTAASAVVIGATLVAGAASAQPEPGPIEVREHPPEPYDPDPPPGEDASITEADAGVLEQQDAADAAPESAAPIEVRDNPPEPPPPPPPAGCCARQPGSEVAWRWNRRGNQP